MPWSPVSTNIVFIISTSVEIMFLNLLWTNKHDQESNGIIGFDFCLFLVCVFIFSPKWRCIRTWITITLLLFWVYFTISVFNHIAIPTIYFNSKMSISVLYKTNNIIILIAEDCKKRWKNIRDSYNRNKRKLGTGSEKMAFDSKRIFSRWSSTQTKVIRHL